MPSTALLTDHYELTMLQAALRSGTAHRRSVFELFARRLPEGRRYGVVAGVGRALDAVGDFRFDDASLAVLSDGQVVDEATLEWLAGYRFTGDVWGYAEGEVYFPYSPVVIVESTFAEAVLLETLLLSIYNHDSAIASAASRMTQAAGDRPCIEMGSRRTHEEAAVACARAAYVAGFATTSNLAARQRYGVPTAGTSAHSFTLLHDTEADAFRAQVTSLGAGTTLLVDTYDVAEAVRLAVEIAGPELGAVRLDSGDLGALAHQVRAQLDSLGATRTRIVVTSDLDEYAIAALASAPVDGYGVGTQLVTGSGHPTSGMVYKLVARESGRREPAASWCRWRRRAPTRSRSVGGSSRCAAAVPTVSPRPRSSASASPPSTTATTARSSSRSCATARPSAASPSTTLATATPRPGPSSLSRPSSSAAVSRCSRPSTSEPRGEPTSAVLWSVRARPATA